MEFLLSPEEKRYVIFPIRHPKIWEMYKKQEQCFWVAEEVDLSKDISDWERLTENERHFITHVLAFFAASDGIVNENLGERFSTEVQVLEAKFFYQFQMMMENIHSEMYSLLIEAYIKDTTKQELAFNAIETMPCIRKKAEWAKKWINDTDSDFATRLVAFAIVEGIFFSASFASIYYLKDRLLMPGLCHSNELISRDEGMHTDFACLLNSMLANPCPTEKVHEIIKEAVIIEKEFICEALPCSLIGMNIDLMSSYVEFVADRISQQLGHTKIYNTSNPFPFLERISIPMKNNFFESKSGGSYVIPCVNKSKEDNSFTLTDDF